MEQSYIANTVLAILITITTWLLWTLGELRIDMYIAMYILEYIMIKTLFKPKRRGIDVLFLALVGVFIIIVSYRLWMAMCR